MQEKNRITVHSGINYCYAQIEEMKHPGLRDVPMAAGGNEEEHHGIILAENDEAKTLHTKAGGSLREALTKYPQLRVPGPDYEEYMYHTKGVKDIYREYTNKVEPLGLDGAQIDSNESTILSGSGMGIARKIRSRVKHELGMAVSMGISYNKAFTKIGSDMGKHKGLVKTTRENYHERIWPLPIQDLFYMGKTTKHKLIHYSIETIGQLTRFPQRWVKNRFGKVGELIWWFANGGDVSEVALPSYQEQMKSVGSAIATPRDIKNSEDAKIVCYVLAGSVASHLREQGLRGNMISVML